MTDNSRAMGLTDRALSMVVGQSMTSSLKFIITRRSTINPFISITPSKPLISSGPGMTLNNFEICYFSAIYYINGIKINILPRACRGGFTANF
jgi:hypothetical protein